MTKRDIAIAYTIGLVLSVLPFLVFVIFPIGGDVESLTSLTSEQLNYVVLAFISLGLGITYAIANSRSIAKEYVANIQVTFLLGVTGTIVFYILTK